MDEEFRKKYSHLAKELEDSPSMLPLRMATDKSASNANPPADLLKGFVPSALDYIRRCKTNEEALEIINYLEAKEEIDSKTAESLRKKLASECLLVFGPPKKPGHYYSCAEP